MSSCLLAIYIWLKNDLELFVCGSLETPLKKWLLLFGYFGKIFSPPSFAILKY